MQNNYVYKDNTLGNQIGNTNLQMVRLYILLLM
jgi:hypothetical protein